MVLENANHFKKAQIISDPELEVIQKCGSETMFINDNGIQGFLTFSGGTVSSLVILRLIFSHRFCDFIF